MQYFAFSDVYLRFKIYMDDFILLQCFAKFMTAVK